MVNLQIKGTAIGPHTLRCSFDKDFNISINVVNKTFEEDKEYELTTSLVDIANYVNLDIVELEVEAIDER